MISIIASKKNEMQGSPESPWQKQPGSLNPELVGHLSGSGLVERPPPTKPGEMILVILNRILARKMSTAMTMRMTMMVR